MNNKMLTYYNTELNYLKHMGDEFAKRNPKVATRLGLNSIESPDPYVERILEGVSFLSARTRLKIDSEYPNFVSRILEVVHPQLLYPTASSAIIKFRTSDHYSNVIQKVRRGETFDSLPIQLSNQEISCTYSTTKTIELTPISLESISYSPSVDFIPERLLAQGGKSSKSLLRLDFSVNSATRCSDLMPKDLSIFLGKEKSVSSQLLYLLMSCCSHVFCHAYENPKDWIYKLGEHPKHTGFNEDEAMVFNLDRSISGLRLFQEYVQLPEKFTFISQSKIKEALTIAEDTGRLSKTGNQLEKIVSTQGVNKRVVAYEKRWFSLSFVFDTFVPDLQNLINDDTLSINSLPIVNIFKKNTIRFPVNAKANEHHVIIDRTQPLNFEVHSIDNARGYDAYNNQLLSFRPVYQPSQIGLFRQDDNREDAFFSIRRTMRAESSSTQKYGNRTSYLGSEVFLSLGASDTSIFESDLQQLSIEAWCTNRDLPLLMPRNSESDFLIDGSLPIEGIHLLTQPVRPRTTVEDDSSIWSLLNLLSLNYLSLENQSATEAGSHLRELLFSIPFSREDVFIRTQIESIQGLEIIPKQKVVRHKGAGSLVRGIVVTLTIDDTLMSGVHPYLISSLIRYFLIRSVSINSFVEMSVATVKEGKIIEWPAMTGNKVTL